jgi:TolB-like protein/Flp pilus assembly protein TadD
MAVEARKEIELEIGHVLFIDIVSYSKMLITEQSELLQTLKQIVRGTEQFGLAKVEGKLLGLPTGDGGALVFRTSPEAPVLCAIEITRKLKDHPELRVRMGIHSGPVNEISDLNEQVNIAGAGINIAQRVMDCGDAGHILLSKRVADDIDDYPQWRPLLHDLGECEVKHGVRVHLVNLYNDDVGNPEPPSRFKPVPVEAAVSAAKPAKPKRGVPWHEVVLAGVVLVGLIAAGMFFLQQRTPQQSSSAATSASPSAPPVAAVPEKSIAVLPFANLSRDPDNAYFADGIQDEILTRLSKISDLKVISRTSTQHYKSAPDNLPEIAKQLAVAHILEGSVQKSADAVRVNVQLIKAANDSHIWADTFDRKLTDIFSVESDISKTVADQLRAKLTGEEEKVIAAKPTDNPEAYDAYLRGLAYDLKASVTPATAIGAQKYLKEAVRLDPKFALGWALLSYVETKNYNIATLQPTAALREEARQAAETALKLQPNLGEALIAMGYCQDAFQHDWGNAVHYYDQARERLPNSSRVPELLAYAERRRGQWDRSESYFNEAERLDPRNVTLLLQHALSYSCLRRFPEAVRKLDQVLNITPDDLDTIASKANIAQAEGDLPRAAALLAPLHPPADDTSALETQAYQAILERHAAAAIPRLKEVLAKPDPALGYFNGELRFWLGWAQECAGDPAAAQESWRQAHSELESFLKEQPDNDFLLCDLALTTMAVGDKNAAVAFSERAMAVSPIEKQAVYSAMAIETFARVAARMGEPERAIAAIEKLLAIPGASPMGGGPLTPAILRLDPMFDPLRNDPRFQKLCEEKPRTPNK